MHPAAPYAACAINSNAINSTVSYRLFGFNTLGLHAGNFWKNVIFCNDPYGHKTRHMSCTWSVRVCLKNFAIVRHGVSEEIGRRQNKQTHEYLVDIPTVFQQNSSCVPELMHSGCAGIIRCGFKANSQYSNKTWQCVNSCRDWFCSGATGEN